MFSLLAVIVVLLIVLFFIIPLFIKKEYVVEQKVVIGKPTPVVFDFVKLLGNQVYYYKWVIFIWLLQPLLLKRPN
jgi:hypothetical protein